MNNIKKMIISFKIKLNDIKILNMEYTGIKDIDNIVNNMKEEMEKICIVCDDKKCLCDILRIL